MKKFQALFLLVVVAIATIFSSFSHISRSHRNVPTNFVWYAFLGTDQTDASSYQKYSPQPPGMGLACPGAYKLCAVLLPDAGSNPNQNDLDNIQTDISTAIIAQTDLNNVELVIP